MKNAKKLWLAIIMALAIPLLIGQVVNRPGAGGSGQPATPTLTNWSQYSTNMVGDTATNAAQNVVNAANLWTNAAGLYYPAGMQLSNTATVVIRTNDGSVFLGRNQYVDIPLDTANPVFSYQALLRSNDNSVFDLDFGVTDDGTTFDCYGILNAQIRSAFNTNSGSAATMSFQAKNTNGANNQLTLIAASQSTLYSPLAFRVGSIYQWKLNSDGSALVTGSITNPALSPSKLVATGPGTNLNSSAYSDTDIAGWLQPATAS